MKKGICLLITLLLFTTLTGCKIISDGLKVQRLDSSDNRIYYERNLINFINKKDSNGIKKLFAPYIVKTCVDLDEGLDYIFSLFKDNIKKGRVYFNEGGMMEGAEDDESDVRNIYAYLTFFYQNNKYEVSMKICILNELYPEKEGLVNFIIYQANNENESTINSKSSALEKDGIYYPKWDEEYYATLADIGITEDEYNELS